MPTNKKRRICIQCGRKRVEDTMVYIGSKHGRYYQANRLVEGYVCTYRKYLRDETCYQKWQKDKRYSPYHVAI